MTRGLFFSLLKMESTTHEAQETLDSNYVQDTSDALPAFEHARYSGAGVLIYAYKPDEETGVPRAYLLIGQERKGSFDDFGGRGKGERHPIITAAREFMEESLGVICKKEEILPKLIDNEILVYDSNFYQYWVNLSLDASVPAKFLKEKTVVKGKQQLKWIAVEDVRRSILEFKERKSTKNNQNFNPFKQPLVCEECVLRKLFIKKMLHAEGLGLLERLQKCEL